MVHGSCCRNQGKKKGSERKRGRKSIPAEKKWCIEGKAMVPVSDEAKAKIIVARMDRSTCNDEGLELLYPEIGTHHAVVCRMKGA